MTDAIQPGRYYHTATLLGNGTVLVTGGRRGYDPMRTTRIYDPAMSEGRKWSVGSELSEPRERHTATIMQSGMVLVAGGINTVPTASAEFYDPFSQQFTPLPPMNDARYEHTATLLPGERIVVMGSKNYDAGSGSCEILEPREFAAGTSRSTGTVSAMQWRWRRLPSMTYGRGRHRASVLPDGTILITGGVHDYRPIHQCERFDPATETWAPAPSMNFPRESHTSTVLPDGRVIVTGGNIGTSELQSCEIFVPWANNGQGNWEYLPNMNLPRRNHTATLVDDRFLLVSGAWRIGQGDYYCEILDTMNPNAGWTIAPATIEYRTNHTATMLTDGRLLLIGGEVGGHQEATPACEISDRTLPAERVPGTPAALTIRSVAPNPFADRLRIGITNDGNTVVHVEIFDQLGRSVRKLPDATTGSGWFDFIWDGRSDSGQQLPPGKYIITVVNGRQLVTRLVHKVP